MHVDNAVRHFCTFGLIKNEPIFILFHSHRIDNVTVILRIGHCFTFHDYSLRNSTWDNPLLKTPMCAPTAYWFIHTDLLTIRTNILLVVCFFQVTERLRRPRCSYKKGLNYPLFPTRTYFYGAHPDSYPMCTERQWNLHISIGTRGPECSELYLHISCMPWRHDAHAHILLYASIKLLYVIKPSIKDDIP